MVTKIKPTMVLPTKTMIPKKNSLKYSFLGLRYSVKEYPKISRHTTIKIMLIFIKIPPILLLMYLIFDKLKSVGVLSSKLKEDNQMNDTLLLYYFLTNFSIFYIKQAKNHINPFYIFAKGLLSTALRTCSLLT